MMKLDNDKTLVVCNGFVMFIMKNRWKYYGLIKQFIRWKDEKVEVETKIINVVAD